MGGCWSGFGFRAPSTASRRCYVTSIAAGVENEREAVGIRTHVGDRYFVLGLKAGICRDHDSEVQRPSSILTLVAGVVLVAAHDAVSPTPKSDEHTFDADGLAYHAGTLIVFTSSPYLSRAYQCCTVSLIWFPQH